MLRAACVTGLVAVLCGCGEGTPRAVSSPAAGSARVGSVAGGVAAQGGASSGAQGGAAQAGGGGAAGADALAATGGVAGGPDNQPHVGPPGLPEVSAEGDGVRTIGPDWADAPLIHYDKDVLQSRQFSFVMDSSQSAIYPGINGPFQRKVSVFVPARYVEGRAASIIVAQDAGAGFQGQLVTSIDNLSAKKQLPPLVTLFVDNGGGDAQGSQRGLEYDTVSGVYAEFVETEVLPRAAIEAQQQLGLNLVFTNDPNGRGTFGASSGGAAAFSMAWWHPDLFRRVLSYSGTFVSQITEPTPLPHGCWVYHDLDPHFVELTEPPRGLTVERCENPRLPGVGALGPCDVQLTRDACQSLQGCAWETRPRQVRVWLESGDKDNGTPGFEGDPTHGPAAYRNFDVANQRMAAALASAGYHYHYDRAVNAYHSDGRVVGQTLPEALLWVWRGHPVE